MPWPPTQANASLGTGQFSRGTGAWRPSGAAASMTGDPYAQQGNLQALQGGNQPSFVDPHGTTSQYAPNPAGVAGPTNTPANDPYATAQSFHAAYGGVPAHEVLRLQREGKPPVPPSQAGPSAPPAQAGAMNAAAPGTFNGNPANGFSGTQVGFNGTPSPPPPPTGPAPGVPTPGLYGQPQGVPGVATPPVPPSQPQPTPGAPQHAPAPPGTPGMEAPLPVTPATPAQPYAPVQPSQASAGEAVDEGRDPYAAPPADAPVLQQGTYQAPGQGQVEQTSGNAQAVGTPGSPSDVALKSAPANGGYQVSFGGQTYKVTEQVPPAWAGWNQAQRTQWLQNHQVQPEAAAPPPVSTAGPGSPVVTPSGDPYVPPQDTADPLDAEDQKSTAAGFTWTNDVGRDLRAHPVQALNRTDLYQNVFGMTKEQAKNYARLPSVTIDPSGPMPTASANHSYTGIDFPQGAFLEGSPNYIQDDGERQLLALAYGYAQNLNQLASTQNGLASQEYAKLAEKLNNATYILGWHGIKYQPWGDYGSTGDTQGEFPGIFTDTTKPENEFRTPLNSVPGAARILSPALKKAFNLNDKSTPEQYALAYEAQMQGIDADRAIRSQDQALQMTGKGVDLIRNDPSRAKSESMAMDIANNPEYSDWEGIRNRATSDSDAAANRAIESASAAAGRRGLDAGALAGLGSDVYRQQGNDLSRQLGELDQARGVERRQGQLQGLDSLGNVFRTYAGAEVNQLNAGAGVLLGAPPTGANSATGVGQAALDYKSTVIADKARQDAKDAAKAANNLGYFTAVTSMIGSMASSSSSGAGK